MTEILSNRNQFIDLQSKSLNWFLYDRGFCYELVNAEAYPGPLQTPKIESFEKIVRIC